MPWVRFDDQKPIHRKVAPLDDATYRLWDESIHWAARNLTDGRISRGQFPEISRRATNKRAATLVRQELWHEAGHKCSSPKCPPSGPDGWVIHDYLDYQFDREKVIKDRKDKADRQARWLEKKKQARDASHNASANASRDAPDDVAPSPTPSPPRREAGTGVPEATAVRADADAPDGGWKPPPSPSVPSHSRRSELAAAARAATGRPLARTNGRTPLLPDVPFSEAVDNPHYDPETSPA